MDIRKRRGDKAIVVTGCKFSGIYKIVDTIPNTAFGADLIDSTEIAIVTEDELNNPDSFTLFECDYRYDDGDEFTEKFAVLYI